MRRTDTGRAVRRAIAAGDSRGIDALEAVLPGRGYVLAGRALDGAQALALVKRVQPELLIADAVLAGLDGVGLVGRIRGLGLDVQPVAVLLRPAGMVLPGEDALSGLGARALEPGELVAALPELENVPIPLPRGKAERLSGLLDALGVPRHPGRDCLERAIALVWADRRRLRPLSDGLYPLLARETGLTPAQAERAMRHGIDVAWRSGEIERQHEIFGDTIDARRGKPTCGEMIAQLADILRWEG